MGQFVCVGEKRVAVFRDGESYRVIDDACPHAGANLSAGFLDNGCVVCPWHFWKIDLRTGRCTNAADAGVNTYQVRVEGERVLAKLGGTRPESD